MTETTSTKLQFRYSCPWHYIFATCKPQAQDYQHSHVSQTAAAPCLRSHPGYYGWLMQVKISSRWLHTWLAYIPVILNQNSVHNPVKCHKMAIYGHNHTITSQDFLSMALLQYGAHPYSTTFCMAVTVYGMVVSPSAQMLLLANIPN